MRPVLIIGAGWSGAVVADRLSNQGVPVEVLERGRVIGGHSRVETLNGVVYEPNGPHILHTNDPDVARFFHRLGLDARPYRHRPLTEIELEDGELRLMSWPIQVEELQRLPDWKRIERELDALPERPRGDDFETYAVSLMGRRLYELFIETYTLKQWGRPASTLSSSFAPKRIDIRRDGNHDLFRDTWQFFPRDGVNGAIEQLLRGVAVTCGADVRVNDLVGADASAIVVTAALDEFLALGDGSPLEWRGVHLRSRFEPTSWMKTASYVINRPHNRVPYTRTIETKHATGQEIKGTVVSEEYPGASAKHYPVDDVAGRNKVENHAMQLKVRDILAPIPLYFCGRLATYRYINQDEAILDAWRCADGVMTTLADRKEA